MLRKNLIPDYIKALLLSLALCFSADVVFAGGVGISPAAFCLQNMDIGKDQDLNVDLIIFNKGDKKREFTVIPQKPSEKTANEKGYSPIPDPSWFYFPTDTISVAPKGQGKLRMHLRIPNEKKYLNQHWMVEVQVTTSRKTMFRLGMTAKYLIETKSSGDAVVKPAGLLGVAPSVVYEEGYVPGKTVRKSFRLFNNDKTAHQYRLVGKVFPPSTLLQISLTPGYQWVKNTNWVKPEFETISIGPGESKDVKVDVLVPKGKKYADQGWEAIIMIEPEKGQRGFVRVNLEQKKDEKKSK